MRKVILTLVSALAVTAAIGALSAASSSSEAQTPSASPTQAVVVAPAVYTANGKTVRVLAQEMTRPSR